MSLSFPFSFMLVPAPEGAPRLGGPVAVELRHLHKYFGETAAVDDVSLQIANGEFFVVRTVRLRQNHHAAHDRRI